MNFKEENDYELLSIVADNEEATEMLFEKYMPLIVGTAKNIYNKYPNVGYDLNDLIQESMVGFSIAINTFDEKKDTTFFTYAKTCINRKLISTLKSATRNKNQLLNESCSVEQIAHNYQCIENLFEDSKPTPEDKLIESENIKEIFAKAKGKLTDLENTVFELKINGFTNKEIAQILDKDIKTISNTFFRIRTKLQKLIAKN